MEPTVENNYFTHMCAAAVVDADIFYILEVLEGIQCLKGIDGIERLERLKRLEDLKGLHILQRIFCLGSFVHLKLLEGLVSLEGIEGVKVLIVLSFLSVDIGHLDSFCLLKTQKQEQNSTVCIRTFLFWLSVWITI